MGSYLSRHFAALITWLWFYFSYARITKGTLMMQFSWIFLFKELWTISNQRFFSLQFCFWLRHCTKQFLFISTRIKCTHLLLVGSSKPNIYISNCFLCDRFNVFISSYTTAACKIVVTSVRISNFIRQYFWYVSVLYFYFKYKYGESLSCLWYIWGD